METGSGKNYLQCTKVADLATEMRRELQNRSKEAAISKSIGFSQINLMLFFFEKVSEFGSMAVGRMADGRVPHEAGRKWQPTDLEGFKDV
ncbi:MAG: hypothetical protein ABW007_17835 [Chitinophagaceae bacterium]